MLLFQLDYSKPKQVEQLFKELSQVKYICCQVLTSACAVITRVSRAKAIWFGDRMRSTQPVSMANPGILGQSQLASSWASTTPPILRIACTPLAPSHPRSVRTTAIARSLKPIATDSNSTSAEGRTKFTRSDWESERVASELTSKWLLGERCKLSAIATAPPILPP